MVKLRDTDDIDVDALEEVEYSTEKYTDYDGEVPPIGLTLSGYVKRMWWTRSAKDDPMIKVLWEASDNDGDNEEYNGCPFWLNASLIPGAKFRWDPFLQAYGIPLIDVKTKTYVDKKEDQNGAPIQRIGTWHPGAERDEAWCWIITDQEEYNGKMQAIAGEWLPWDEAPDGEAPEDEEPEDADDEADEADDEDEEGYEDEDEDEEGDEDEPEDEEPEPPARTRKTRATATRTGTSARASKTASKPATARAARSTRSGAAKPATARTARSGKPRAGTAGKATAGKAAPARSTRTRRAAKDGDPPF